MNQFNDWTALFQAALKEDAWEGDHSSLCCIPPDLKGIAVLKIKEEGILAGVEVVKNLFLWKEPSAVFTAFKNDGDEMMPGEIVFKIEASVHTILLCERLALNCMQRMSGIATLTRLYASKLEGYHTRLLDTRKTTPNFRIAEKEAVRIGGGINHRYGLSDMIMLKDNHIDYCGGITKAILKADEYVKKWHPNLKIEVEARTLEEVEEVLEAGKNKVFRIMLDNFTPMLVSKALNRIDGSMETEASGGINLSNIIDFADTGVDFVSVGSLVHQARSLDLSLKASF
jgi:nicotinate-nucleotide pyrophosphorylase (carboxylating)